MKSVSSGCTNGSNSALVFMDSLDNVASVKGEIHTPAEGRAIPSSRSLIRQVNVKVAPAESPAITIFSGFIPFDNNHLYAIIQSSNPAGNGCSGASL